MRAALGIIIAAIAVYIIYLFCLVGIKDYNDRMNHINQRYCDVYGYDTPEQCTQMGR